MKAIYSVISRIARTIVISFFALLVLILLAMGGAFGTGFVTVTPNYWACHVNIDIANGDLFPACAAPSFTVAINL